MLRWENYFMKSNGNFDTFWKTYQEHANPDILFIMGMGFDPRTNLGIESIFSVKSKQRRDTILLRYFKTVDDIEIPPVQEVKEHLDRLNSFLLNAGFPAALIKNTVLRSEDDKSIASINATYIIPDFSVFEKYSDIIIDISAMPRGIFIPLINKCLDLVDQYNVGNDNKKNLHVIVTENSKLDSFIEDRGTDETATYIHGFRIKEIGKTDDQKEVWIPILGENQTSQFDKIKLELNPVEVCPILPFPCDDLRRGDKLIIEYQERLLNDNNVELKNIVYADESNPFQVYRLLNKTIQRYNESFSLLAGCKIIVSALSSKLLTVGAFMAAYEKKKEGLNIGIMHVESLRHEMKAEYEEQKIEIAKHNKLFEIWLAGTPYYEA
jgi:hypothetical protein